MKTLKIAAGVLIIAALAVSCIPKAETMGDAGQTLVKLNPTGFSLLAVDAKTTAQTGILFEVRRDVQGNAALNDASVSATLKYDTDTAILKAYNLANSKTFIPLPASLGTVSPAITAGQLTFNFAAGEFAKSIMINLPSSASFDFSKQYALAFKLLSVSGSGTVDAAYGTTVVAQVLAKNQWDGTYHCVGYRIRPGNATEPVDQPEKLNTKSATTVQKNGFGNYGSYDIKIEITTTTMVVGGTTCYKVIATPVDAGGNSVGDMFTTWTGDALTPPTPPGNATEINYYNPVLKQFVLNCYYLSGAGNRIMYEVLTRTGN